MKLLNVMCQDSSNTEYENRLYSIYLHRGMVDADVGLYPVSCLKQQLHRCEEKKTSLLFPKSFAEADEAENHGLISDWSTCLLVSHLPALNNCL